MSYEFDLTKAGMENYRSVLALIFEYMRVVKEQWLAAGEPLEFFTETKTISSLSY